MTLVKTFIPLFLLIFIIGAGASPALSEEVQEGGRSNFALPVMFYTTDTGFGYGASGIAGYKTREARTSQVVFSVINTTRNQFDVYAQWLHIFPGDRSRFLLETEYSRFPQYYYGQGNATSNADPALYTPETEKIDLTFERVIRGDLRWKAGGFFRNRSIQKRGDDDAFLSTGAPWAKGRADGGPRFGILFDSRDNLIAPTSGTFAQTMYEGSWLRDGGGVFSTFTGEFRTYREVLPHTTLASLVLLKDTRGDAPIYFLSSLGGQSLLRGYEYVRFTGRSLVLAQQDLRFPIWRRLGGCAFIGTGRVADHISGLSGRQWHFSGGAGLRYFINRADGLVLRFDTAFGNGVQGTYITFGEAF